MLAHWHLFARSRPRQNVWIDVSECVADVGTIDAGVERVLHRQHLRLAGMCCALETPGAGERCLDACIDRAVAAMEHIRRRHGVLLSQLAITIADASIPAAAALEQREVSAVIEDCLDAACARYRYPRPTVTLLLHTVASTPTGPSHASTLDMVRDATLELS
ncbi:hypothetical protein RAJCM14343_1338 [Rhodococcus aetherivorans]|uniref:Uncharacterized protein n=1 Tax=Rhodococcus aetherivorans TaxID=191292 RepID=A0ABQ0YHX4_9NOCA|nr:hypothetical protein [Rhodococcus aetherivorans]ETT25172.1 hypothetical protein RR21198_0219 [Rhodococcus rhodochrous ATCC 21198]NGP29299.1 hypothetical protein [Rhodococcus aetherivorans]GES36089.1 hypothetical protein RAJCM14343_1338 [Rhodococcus aetherivorans]